MLVSIINIYNKINIFFNIDSFKCKISPSEKTLDKQLSPNSDYTIILSGDTFILFENILPQENKAKIVFWANILSITDLQIDKLKKTASINFFDDIENNEYHIKLIIENIIIFRDTLISKMNALDIRVVSKMIDPMKQLKRRITLKDMTKMSLEEIENEVKELKAIIEKGEVDSYTVNTFTTLCGKAIEELNRKNDDMRQIEIMNMMKNVLQMEQVKKLTEMERNKDKIGEINMNNKNINENNNEIKTEDKKEEIKKEEEKKEEKKEEDKNEIVMENK